MIRTYTTYALTLLSAFMVYWMFGVMATVAAGDSWLPFLAFLVSVIHFGVSSWLYLNLPKVGKGLAILTALLMCIWPIAALIGSSGLYRRESNSGYLFIQFQSYSAALLFITISRRLTMGKDHHYFQELS
jgi:hypothetical protein